MDTLGALALATEPPTDELMKRTPVKRNANFISKPMWRNILGHSAYQFTVLAVLTFDGKRILGLNGSDSQAVLNTVIFNSFVFCQVSSCFPSSYLYHTFFLPLFSVCYEYPRLAHTKKEIIVQLPETVQKLHLVVARFMLSVHIQRDNFKWTAIASMKKRNWNSI